TAAAAPLNPSYTADEFRFFLGDLEPTAVIVAADEPGPVRGVARELGVPVLEADTDTTQPSRHSTLQRATVDPSVPVGGPPQPDDVALLLHTSGTTSRPKLVPLT